MPSATQQPGALFPRQRPLPATKAGPSTTGLARATLLGTLMLLTGAPQTGCRSNSLTQAPQRPVPGKERAGSSKANSQDQPVYELGEDVSAPVPVFNPRPPYTEDARGHEIEGVVKLKLIVGSNGDVSDVQQVSRPLGYGLDESAVRTVRTWRFRPGKKKGLPVAVRIQLGIFFRPD